MNYFCLFVIFFYIHVFLCSVGFVNGIQRKKIRPRHAVNFSIPCAWRGVKYIRDIPSEGRKVEWHIAPLPLLWSRWSLRSFGHYVIKEYACIHIPTLKIDINKFIYIYFKALFLHTICGHHTRCWLMTLMTKWPRLCC